MSTASECKSFLNPSMLIFGVHGNERVAIDVPLASTVGEVKKQIQVIRIRNRNNKLCPTKAEHFNEGT